MRRQPRHLAVHPGGHESVVAGDILIQGAIGSGDPHGVKPELGGPGPDAASPGSGIGALLRVIGI
jgi:hypothetical protein